MQVIINYPNHYQQIQYLITCQAMEAPPMDKLLSPLEDC